ncbi:MAG: NAD(P)H-dependent oxidoreductase subunit E, partial [Lentisphaerae bacterium]|nr:NAD(P)H-dependent oxidoreductase subunit E [Lentisphaerota bacterium]
MTASHDAFIRETCDRYDRDRTRLMDIVRDIQREFGCVSGPAMDAIAAALDIHRVEVEGVVSFYSFLSEKPQGSVVVRLCDDIIDRLNGFDAVADACKDALGIDFDQTTADGKITLERCAFIGMGDQAPAALVNDTVLTCLTPDGIRSAMQTLMSGGGPDALVTENGDGNNAHPLVRSMVRNNLREPGPVVFAPLEPGAALAKAAALTPAEVIRDVKTSRLRGRGGAGFPTG